MRECVCECISHLSFLLSIVCVLDRSYHVHVRQHWVPKRRDVESSRYMQRRQYACGYSCCKFKLEGREGGREGERERVRVSEREYLQLYTTSATQPSLLLTVVDIRSTLWG